MEKSKEFATKLNHVLLPNEESVMKFQDVLLFHNKTKTIILFAVANLLFLLLWLLPFNSYTYIFFGLALLSISSLMKPLFPLLEKIFLGSKVAEIPADSAYQRYTVSQITAYIATIYYIILSYFQQIKETIQKKEVAHIFLCFFLAMTIYYIFISFGDAFILWVIMNIILLLPSSIRKNPLSIASETALAQKQKLQEMMTKKETAQPVEEKKAEEVVAEETPAETVAEDASAENKEDAGEQEAPETAVETVEASE